MGHRSLYFWSKATILRGAGFAGGSVGLLTALCPRLGRCAAGARLRTFRSGVVLWAGAHLSLGGAWARRGSPGQQAKEVSANAGGELADRKSVV